MSIISLGTTWSDGQVLTASALNGNFTTIVNDYNGGITNANISGSAAIATSKINATFPSGSIVGTTDSQTLTNKTLTAPTITGTVAGSPTITTPTFTKPTVNASLQGVTALSGTTPSLDLSVANVFTITMTGATTYSVTNASVGQCFMVESKQGSGTTYTNTWFSGITWVTSGGSAPPQTTTSNGYTTYGFRCIATNTYLGYLVGTN